MDPTKSLRTHITGSCFVGHQLPYPRLPWYRRLRILVINCQAVEFLWLGFGSCLMSYAFIWLSLLGWTWRDISSEQAKIKTLRHHQNAREAVSSRNDIELVLCNPNHCLRHRDSCLVHLGMMYGCDLKKWLKRTPGINTFGGDLQWALVKILLHLLLFSPKCLVTCISGTGLVTSLTGNQTLEPEPGTTDQDRSECSLQVLDNAGPESFETNLSTKSHDTEPLGNRENSSTRLSAALFLFASRFKF